MADNRSYVYRRLRRELGLTPAQAAGAVGGLGGESGRELNPNAVNSSSGALGIGQWLGGRARGVRKGDVRQQTSHLIAELKGPERAALSQLKRAHTIDDATSIFVRAFERPSAGEIASSMPSRLGYARDAFNAFHGLSGGGGSGRALVRGSRSSGGRPASTRTTIETTPGVDNRLARSALVQSFLEDDNSDVLDFAVQAKALADVPATSTRRTVRTPGVPATAERAASSGGGRVSGARGEAKITGPNPSRIIPAVRDFMREISAVRGGKPVVGSDGTGHSYLTVNGNVSEHSTGHASDIPASGRELINLGQAALIAAGMPRAQARQKTGGLFNVTRNGRRYQIIFNTHEGGDHTDHLHVGIKGGR